MDKREALDRFRLQSEILKQKNKKREAAYVDVCSECFMLSYEFTIEDWRGVREGDYFDVMDETIGVYNKALLKLSRIKQYLKREK